MFRASFYPGSQMVLLEKDQDCMLYTDIAHQNTKFVYHTKVTKMPLKANIATD